MNSQQSFEHQEAERIRRLEEEAMKVPQFEILIAELVALLDKMKD